MSDDEYKRLQRNNIIGIVLSAIALALCLLPLDFVYGWLS